LPGFFFGPARRVVAIARDTSGNAATLAAGGM
jgi:hypothetical protein